MALELEWLFAVLIIAQGLEHVLPDASVEVTVVTRVNLDTGERCIFRKLQPLETLV
jgi:hypothetical protein